MKNLVFFILFAVFLVGCSHKENEEAMKSNDNNIDDLLAKANDFNLDKNVRAAYTERVRDLISNNANDSLTRYYYFKLAGRYYNLEDYDHYLKICREVYVMSQESNDTLNSGKSLQYIGDYYYTKFKNDSAYFYFSKAEKTYSKLKNRVSDIDRLKLYKANILFYEKDFSGCETAIVNILKTIKKKKDGRLMYDCYITLGNALNGLNDSEKAIEYYNKAFEMTNGLKDDYQYPVLKAQTYNYLGRVYQKENQYKKALNYFEEALRFGNFKNTDPLMYANLINNSAYSKLKLGDKSALKLFNEALLVREGLHNIPGVVSSKINLSEYFLAQNDTAHALTYCKEAQEMAHVNKIYEDELKALELLVKIDPKNDAFYSGLFIKLTERLQNDERAARNKFARIEYETDEIINQKNNIEAEKNEISTQRWVILGFSLFFILVLVLIYIAKMQHSKNKELQFEKNQQKANEEIYQLMLNQQSKIDEGRESEKKRIAQELHDGVMSKLTSTRLNLFILSKKTDEETIRKCLIHIAEIQNIEKEIRSISHDLSKDIFSGKDSFKTIIEALFEGQKDISKANWQLEIEDAINWETIESTTKMHLYRIFQESLQNIHKYAKAKNVNAVIHRNDSHIHVEIYDDGIGFDLKKTKEGIGLKNMQSRMKVVHGNIEVQSSVGKGTKINLVIPL